ncbi:MAG: hypothetical protein V7K14_21115 [Nostoc sp.]|uniref:hypothetical protein n=1 Tax=Nostoc sp. TaxID=1180 RepID=UPI002FFC73E8
MSWICASVMVISPDYVLLVVIRHALPKKADGSYDRESPLSPYQAWILGRVGRLMAQLRRGDRVNGRVFMKP